MTKKYDYVVGEKGDVYFKDSSEFLKWLKKDNKFLKNIKFLDDSLETSKMKVMYEFLMDYIKIKDLCEKQMSNYNDIYSMEDNRLLQEAMDQFVLNNSNGKYLRAFLVSLGYHSFGKNDDEYIPLSLALEIFQTSILIHDDIIDKALVRRGVPTIPVRYNKIYSDALKDGKDFYNERESISNSMALCIGDLGLYLANQMILKKYSNNSNLGDVLGYYNDIAIMTCKGEMLDVILPFYEKYYGDVSDLENQIFDIYRLKTGWYSVVGPFVLGSILAGVKGDKIHMLEDALMNLGVAYQIKDDLLGIFGTEEGLGKSVYSDVEEYKQTILYYYVINTEYKDEFLELYGTEMNIEKSEKIKEILDKSGAKKYAVDTMDKLFQESFNDILKLDFLDSHYKKILLGFAEYLRVREK